MPPWHRRHHCIELISVISFPLCPCRNLARRSTIIISPDYTLIKNKLYNSFLE